MVVQLSRTAEPKDYIYSVACEYGWAVYRYLVTFMIFHLNRLNKAVLLINTENRIIEILNGNRYYSDTCFGMFERND